MSSTITHIVLFQYHPTIPWSTLESHFTSFRSLQQRCLHPLTDKPYMLSLRMGKNRSWEPFSKNMTHGFVLEFASQDDLDYYLTRDPVHLEFSRKAKDLIKDSVVVDIVDGVVFGEGPEAPKGFGGAKEEEVRGACHCGRVRWGVKLGKREHVLCHCDTCKKLGGGPYSCNQIVTKEDLRILEGELRVYTYQGASGKDVRCYYCGNCTSHVYHHQDAMPDKVIVRTLLLEGGSDMDAGGEIFPEGRLKWVKELKDSLDDGPKMNGTK